MHIPLFSGKAPHQHPSLQMLTQRQSCSPTSPFLPHAMLYLVDCPTQLTLTFMILHLYLSVVFHDKYQKYKKHSRDICYGFQILIQYIAHSGTEVSAETLNTTEATNLESGEAKGDPGLGNQTTSSPGK